MGVKFGRCRNTPSFPAVVIAAYKRANTPMHVPDAAEPAWSTEKDMAETATHGVAGEAPPLRDTEGAIRPDLSRWSRRRSGARCRAVARAGRRTARGRHRRSDRGARSRPAPAAHRADGQGLRLTALTEVDDTVREEILEELDRDRRRGRARLDSDDAVYILEDLPKDEQAENLEQMSPTDRVASRSASTTRKVRRAAHADRDHRGAAELDRRSDDRLHARNRGPARALLRNLRGRHGRRCSA